MVTPNGAPRSAYARYDSVVTALLVFGFVCFARLWLVRAFGSPVPYWDQWEAEAHTLYRPWLDGTFHGSVLFSPHNEHRIVLTRLVDLGLFAATGRWETWWLLVLNAALNAKPLSRYQDVLVPGALGSLSIILGVMGRGREARLVSIGWIGLLVTGLFLLNTRVFCVQLPFIGRMNQAQLEVVRSYIATRDPAVYERASRYERPYLEAAPVLLALDDPRILAALPPELSGGPSSRPRLIQHAPWLTVLSGLGLLITLWTRRRAMPTPAGR